MSRAKIATDNEGRCIGIEFMCPGCNRTHLCPLESAPAGMELGARPSWITAIWKFKGDLQRPTLHPSVVFTTGHYCSGQPQPPHCLLCSDDPARSFCSRCHSFVREGRIEFLGDCTHALAGKTVDLPEVEQCSTP